MTNGREGGDGSTSSERNRSRAGMVSTTERARSAWTKQIGAVANEEVATVRETTNYTDKMRIHKATSAYLRGRLSRRELVKILAAGRGGLTSRPRFPGTAARPAVRALAQESQAAPEGQAYLKKI